MCKTPFLTNRPSSLATYTLESEARCQAERITIYAVPTYTEQWTPSFSLVPGIMRRGGSKPRGRERSAAQRSAGSETESSHSGPSGFPFLSVSQGARGKKAFHHRATPSRQPPGRVTLALYTRAHSPTLHSLPYLPIVPALLYPILIPSSLEITLAPCKYNKVGSSFPPSVVLSSLVHPFYPSTLHLTYLPCQTNLV